MCNEVSMTVSDPASWSYSHTNDKALAIPPPVVKVPKSVDMKRLREDSPKLPKPSALEQELNRRYSRTNDRAREIPPIVVKRARKLTYKVEIDVTSRSTKRTTKQPSSDAQVKSSEFRSFSSGVLLMLGAALLTAGFCQF
eukprot:TRINITY_DN29077_c0_g1_i1.p1 TRINITY_DN29077_c0_g1~~TRINITY_DN29077_c0_g1_i1.p1  ORF type:complete len:140 (+),score=11.29 TRINITY_DN29077_c0_g1_i1:65-484(+)